MSKLIILVAIFLPTILLSQNVAINNDGSIPHISSILDIKSNSKGLLMPRLTTLERTNIATPAIGLTVFDLNTFSYWMFRGDVNGGWAEMQHNYQNFWSNSGSNVFNTNVGNIGIGTNAPGEKLTLNAPNATIQFMNNGTPRGFLQTNNADMRLGTYGNNTTGKLVFNTKAVDRMWIDEDGQLGIGTANPASLLTVNGSNPYVQIQHNNVNTGFLQAVGSNLKLGTNSTNLTGNLFFQTKLIDRMMVDENGQVGIGTNSPTSILSINSANPIVQLKNSGVDKGFVQLVLDDIKIGTNSSNTYGRYFVRTGGADRLVVNHDGKVGIGTSLPYATLSLNNATPKIDFNISDNRYGYVGIEGVNEDMVIQRDERVGKVIVKNGNGWGIYLHDNGYFNYGSGLNPAGYPFSVTGRVLATEFITLAVANWPDYVFADSYKLKPLAEVKEFIEINKHLPNIPPATEMEKNGIPLGDMSKKLMEKVEELTLYIINLQEQIDELKKNK